MPSKANDRLAKLASFGASAAAKQIQPLADPGDLEAARSMSRASLEQKSTPGQSATPVPHSTPMIRNIAFTAREQEILRVLMDHLRREGELTPNLSLAVKVGLRLIPEHPSPEAIRHAVLACKALDGRRKPARAKPGV